MLSNWKSKKVLGVIKSSSFPKQQNLDNSKLKGLADDNFQFDENGRKLSKRVENTVGKGQIAHFQKTCTADM